MATASYPIINDVACVPEIQVSFKTYNQTDQQTYYGTVDGCVNYAVAAAFGDIDAIHGNMSAAVAKQNITSQTFILITTNDGVKRPFATIWINPSTFKQTDNATDANLIVHNITATDLATLITTIRDMGFDISQKKL